MAKRTPRSQAEDAAATTPAEPSKGGRARARKSSTAAQGDPVTADDPTVASAPTIDTTEAARPAPSDQHPPEDAIGTEPRVSEANRFERGGAPTHDEIRRRAYELYLARGGRHGMDHDDWYRAEQELRGKTS